MMNLKNLVIACVFVAFSSNAMNIAGEENHHLAGVQLPHVEKTIVNERYIDISGSKKFIQQDLRNGDEGCGYDSLNTLRIDVYNAIKELYCDKWNDLQTTEKDLLKNLMYSCVLSYGEHIRYNGPADWNKLNAFCKENIIDDYSTTAELLELICYIKGWNLTIYFGIDSGHYMSRTFNEKWETKYLLFVNDTIEHWERLVPRD